MARVCVGQFESEGVPVGYLSRNDIEDLAARVIHSYRTLPRFAGQTVSQIDPQILACELCGLTLAHCRLSRSGGTLGLTAFGEIGVMVFDGQWHPILYELDGKTILVESALRDDPAQRGRYHFTVMHEAAHQILSRVFLSPERAIQRRVIYYRGGPVQDWSEWQADGLASALLMPPDIVRSALAQFGLPDGIEMLNRVFRPQTYERFCEMSDYLGVSKQALAIRLKRLGWLKKDYLRNPYGLVDIEKEEAES
jgi:Zn-dependent peptidase ImmA (M78 family)